MIKSYDIFPPGSGAGGSLLPAGLSRGAICFYPPFGPGSKRLNRDANFAEVRTALQMAIGLGGLIEREDLIDDRMDLVNRHRAIHSFEHLARADQDALDARIFEQQRHRIDLAGAAQDADQTDDAAGFDGIDRFG